MTPAAPAPAVRLRLAAALAVLASACGLALAPAAEAAFPRYASASAFRESVGIATHPSYYDTPYGQWDKVVARLRELGVHHIRGGFFASGNAGWQARQAAAYRDAYAAGIRANLVLDLRCSPTGLVDPCLAGVKSELPAGSVESVEWLNEHDLFGGANWKDVLQTWGRALYTKVKADPVLRSLRVIGPSLVYPNAPLVLGDQSAWLDAGNIHPYTGASSPNPLHIAAELTRIKAVSGSKPVVATEAGFHTSPAATNVDQPAADEPTAAVYTLRTVLEHFADGIDRTYLYELIDQRVNLLDSQSNYGLLHTDFTPKPAFTQLKNLLAMIGSSAPAQVTPVGFSIAGDTSDARTLVLQQDDGRYALVVWRTASVWDRDAKRRLTVAPRRYVVTVPSATAVSTGNPATGTSFTPAALSAGSVTVDVGADPLVLQLTIAPPTPPPADPPTDPTPPADPPTDPTPPADPPTDPTPPADPPTDPTPPADPPTDPTPPADPPTDPTPPADPAAAGPLPTAPSPAAPAPDAGERPRVRTGGPAPAARRRAARLTRMAVHRVRGRWVAAFRLSARARVRLDLRRGGHAVRRSRASSLRTGAHRVRVGRLRPGHYRLRITAVTQGGRATVRTLRFRVARRAR